MTSKNDWQKALKFDPIPRLVESGNPAIAYLAEKDLLNHKQGPIERLWKLRQVEGLVRSQQPNGSWKYPGGNARLRSAENYDLLKTYTVLRELVEKYGVTRKHETMKRAAEFALSFQTDSGDIRGIYGNQFTPNYTAGITELLVKAGFDRDPRIEKSLRWLLSIRQKDGAWAIPFRTVGGKFDERLMHTRTVDPDVSRPSSWLVTGVVLRAFAAYPKHGYSKEIRRAIDFLESMLFKKDNYPDRSTPIYWTSFTFPFWFTDLLSATDSLSRLGVSRDDSQISKALDWFRDNQKRDGTWELRQLRPGGDKDVQLWSSLAICRVFKRFYK